MTSALIAGSLPSGNATGYDVDIIILAMDRVDETLEAIASALAQEGVSRHVLVFDQGSTDENLARLATAVEGRLDVALVRAERNYGVAGGRNRVTSLGHGRVIVALDNDAEFATTDTVARAVSRIDAEPDLAAIGFRVVIHSSGADDLSSWGYPSTLLPRSADMFDTVTFVGAGHAISRRAWNECGGYDEKLFFCWEEFDFCLNAISKGWRMQYCGDLVVRHKVSPDRRFNWSGTRWCYYVRNRR
jgi:GT2 family glycosyltransferase